MALELDISIFESIHPSRFISFTIPNPVANPSLSSPLIRIAVLDSPVHPTTAAAVTTTTSSSYLPTPNVAAMFVPKHRESDWVFSTESGHLQLLLTSPNIQRLVLIGQQPNIDGSPDPPSVYRRPMESESKSDLEVKLQPLVIALCPRNYFESGKPEVPFLSYEDSVVSSLVLEKCAGNFVGEMLVEDVEIETNNREREFRRRLRFKRMPNLIQTEICIVPLTVNGLDSVEIIGNGIEFRPDLRVLVHVYLVPMVASLALISSVIEERFQAGFSPKALCLGVGGGALLGFLKSRLGFQVLGVEADEEVLRIARKYFGLEDEDFIRVCLGDGMELMEKLACGDNGDKGVGHVDAQFDVIMVDLDSTDLGNGVVAPPLEFIRKDVLLAARSILCKSGILVINVIPPTRLFYDKLIHEFRDIFPELYEIDVGNGENFVLIATALPAASSISDCENNFLEKLKLAISGAYMDSIKGI